MCAAQPPQVVTRMKNLRIHTRLADLMRDLDGYLSPDGVAFLSPMDAAVAVNCMHRLRGQRLQRVRPDATAVAPSSSPRQLTRRYEQQLRALIAVAAAGIDVLDPWRIAMVRGRDGERERERERWRERERERDSEKARERERERERERASEIERVC
jgi:hypothetical protein